MVKKGRKSNTVERGNEKDSTYFLKIVLYVIAGAFWLRFAQPLMIGDIAINAIPLGFIVGVLIARHEKLQIDRKIEYALLLISAIVSVFLGTGIVI